MLERVPFADLLYKAAKHQNPRAPQVGASITLRQSEGTAGSVSCCEQGCEQGAQPLTQLTSVICCRLCHVLHV